MAANEDKLQELKDLVNKAKGLLDKVEEPKEKSTETLRALYPSTKGKANDSSKQMKRSFKFPLKKFNKKLKPNQVKECMKDFFFLMYGTTTVPRKRSREFYYENGLVASAITITSEMGEIQIKEMIREQIPAVFERKPFTDFSFVKAVGEHFVLPKNIVEWNYKTIRHIYGNGPVYVRADKPIDGFSEFENKDFVKDDEEENIEDDEKRNTKSQSSCQSLKNIFDKRQQPSKENSDTSVVQINKEDSSSCSSSKTVTDFFKPTLSCPICYQKFSQEILSTHASKCAEKKYDFIEYPSFDDLSDKEDGDQTVPFDEEEVDTEDLQAKKRLRDEELENLVEIQKSGKTDHIRCRRDFVWDDFVSHQEKPWTNSQHNLVVTFLTESGVDTGGPKREFLTECLKQISTKILQDGMPVKSLFLVNKKHFLYAGQLMAVSLLQNGPVPRILSDWCYMILSSSKGVDPMEFNPSDEFLLSSSIRKLVEAKTDEDYQTVLQTDEAFELLEKIGYCGLPTKETLAGRDSILKLIYYKTTIEPRLPALNQLADGLAVRGLINLVRKNPLGYKDCFVKSGDEPNITPVEFLEEIDPIFSTEGSNKRIKEELIFKHFCDYIELCHYDEKSVFKLTDVCQFITGSSTIPIHRFDQKICIYFMHECKEGCHCMPVVSTCALSLTFPKHINSFEEMTDIMNRAITESPFFGKV